MVAAVDFLPVCLQRGYLKASFADSDARVVTQSGSEVEVDAIFAVTPGKVYSTSSVEWKGNAVVKVEDLQHLIHLPTGQPADAVRLVTDLEDVAKLYHTRGYMTARITPKPLLDDDKSTVHYDLYVIEGDQFKMGELEIVGLDSQAKAHLQAAWTLGEGEPYNGEYPKQFLEETSRLLPRGVPWGISIHEAVNEKDKTVDVTLRFTPK
jgi:outer membrane protein assembly factor BamA